MEFLSLISGVGTIGKITIALIIFLFIFSFTINLIIRKKYKVILDDLNDWDRRKEYVFSNDVLNQIINEYKRAALGSLGEVNTPSIIEKAFTQKYLLIRIGERFLKNSNSLLITMGLLGTFVGLTIAIGNIADVFTGMDIEEIMATAGQDFFCRPY